jgi:hypothetical protein
MTRATLLRGLAVVILVVLGYVGLPSAIEQLSSAQTAGQQIATATQFGYAVLGLVAAGALVARRAQWARPLLWGWAACLTTTGGLAPVVWGGAGVGAGLAAAAASALIAALVLWLGSARPAA